MSDPKPRGTGGPKPLQLTALTVATGDTRTLRLVVSRWSRRLERAFVSLPVRLLAASDRPLYVASVQAWRALKSQDRGLAAGILRLPTHAVLLECAVRHAGPGGDHVALTRWVRELSALVLLELATLRRLPAEPVLRFTLAAADWPALRSIRLNWLLRLSPSSWGSPGQEVTVTFASGRLQLAGHLRRDGVVSVPLHPDADLAILPPTSGLSVSRPYLGITPGVRLALSDNNPLSDFEAHPDKDGNSLSLGDKPAEDWVASLRACFTLIARYLPELSAELQLIARLIVPVGWDPERHLSASYQEYIGAIYMTLHPNAMTMTEAVIHEFQHNKINAAFNLDPLLYNGFSPLFTSPVRPDPRPLHGVILAVHAFQPVALLYERMRADGHPMSRDPHWLRRFEAIVGKIRDGAATVLSNAQPTAVGRPFFAEMRRWDGHFARLQAAGFLGEEVDFPG